MKLFGLKKVRETFGFTMRELADRLDVTPNTINLWEKGKLDVTDARVSALLYFFKVTPEILSKEEHSIEELIDIEIARSTFKLEEYREQITDERKKSEIVDWIFKFRLEEDRMEDFKNTVERLGVIFSRLDLDDYCTFDQDLNELLDLIIENDVNWYKLGILVRCLYDTDDDGGVYNITPANRDEYMIDNLYGAKEEAIITIREKLEALYIKELYDRGEYTPTWEIEKEKRKNAKKN
ncbi:helix-turn-helix domain-containing protein [Clostridium beijerinckii]|uniref:Transcriptional regulator with XRE-family HTH domain n=1 Tax=Clostridium beijerinckii TaxID=1520 RepID=A0AAX0B0R7_CLOBE|nr:helix-turn-helix transcriptional regulator [Clostridium beijerinckii]NRT88900.1 transcriptional regulator with XRE-family HTH domain [Clostridium beijerinckii]NYC74355.1 transcriptional regulator with XRE-family HTH domain [Clostridium beijerinckii]